MRPWFPYLQVEDLHGDYASLATAIGLELTVRFAETWYGGPLILPYADGFSNPDQLRSGYLDIYAATSCLELTTTVARKLGGGQLYLPQARHALLTAKERYVIANDKICNRRQLARDTGLSLRHIYRVCRDKTEKNRQRRNADPDQMEFAL